MWSSRDPLDAYALVHMCSAAGDALVALGLAGSIFFSLPIGQARVRVALYLALTMAPLAVAAPILVPLLDRSGFRRVIVFSAAGGRSIAAIFAAPRTAGLVLFPVVFAILVLSKIHGVTRNGLVAAYGGGSGERLLAANARLGRLAAIAVALAAIPGLIALKLGGTNAALYTAAVAYAGCAALTLRLPEPAEPLGAAAARGGTDGELRRGRVASLATAAAATASLRGAQGFLVLLFAFSVRRAGEPSYWLGLLVFAGVAGGFLGDLIGPRLPHGIPEQSVVLGSLVLAGVAAVATADLFSLPALTVFALLAGVATETGRLAFQSLMQQAAPGGVSGRVFVRYEVAFQLAWVAGAFLPAMFPIPFRLGVVLLAAFYLLAGVTFLVRSRSDGPEEPPEPNA